MNFVNWLEAGAVSPTLLLTGDFLPAIARLRRSTLDQRQQLCVRDLIELVGDWQRHCRLENIRFSGKS
jgi:hypothetical protein